MRITTFAVLSLLFSAGAAGIPPQHARAQDAPAPAANAPPPAQDATPPVSQASPPPATPGATTPASTSAPAANASSQSSSAITHRNINLRGGPGTQYALLRLITAGSPVEVKECKNGWCQVMFQGTDGYLIESSIATNASRSAARRRFRPMPGYTGPPPAYVMRLPGYYPPRPYLYYYGPYYPPYWAWRRAYWRGW